MLFCLIVAVAANTRGRHPFGWFLLSLILSPLIGGLFVLALPRRPIPAERALSLDARDMPAKAFVPDGVYGGIPYRVIASGHVEAMFPTGLIRFRTMDQFLAASNRTHESS